MCEPEHLLIVWYFDAPALQRVRSGHGAGAPDPASTRMSVGVGLYSSSSHLRDPLGVVFWSFRQILEPELIDVV